jgi:thiol-disulfide isomerase/thioredoxin
MRYIIYLFLVVVFISCDKKEENKSLKVAPKNAIVIDYEGKEIPLPKDKLIILNFLAYSCSSCMEEIPILKKVLKEDKYKDRFYLVGLVIDSKENDLSDKQFPIYANNKINQVKFPVPGTPTTYIISPEGKKLVIIYGAITEENLRKFLDEALIKYKKIQGAVKTP